MDVNGTLIFSKLQTGRHALAGEVIGLIQNFIKEA